MPRMVDYPRASLKTALAVAAAVDALGGSCTDEMVAQRLGRKHGSGGFNSVVGAAVKYGLVVYRKATLTLTSLYARDFKHAYNDAQKAQALRTAFMGVPLFRKVYERFVAKTVPEDILDKLLIREFEVPEDVAGRVGQYFLEAARMADLFTDGGVLRTQSVDARDDGNGEAQSHADADGSPLGGTPTAPAEPEPTPTTEYVVRITGPGISSTVELREADDLLIVDAVLAKVRKGLKEVQQ